MNKYEEKAKQFYKSRTKHLNDYIEDDKKVSSKISELIDLIHTLEIAKTHAPMAAAELDKNINGYKEEIKNMGKKLEYIQDNILVLKDSLNIFSNYICPHEKTTFDHDDYHKGVDYYKCDLCGAIV
jgi:chromosome segregation ATPase